MSKDSFRALSIIPLIGTIFGKDGAPRSNVRTMPPLPPARRAADKDTPFTDEDASLSERMSAAARAWDSEKSPAGKAVESPYSPRPGSIVMVGKAYPFSGLHVNTPIGATGAVKFDTDKLPLDLVPFDAVEAIAEILAFGAKKYAARNWEKGMDWSRAYSACLRHLWAWWMRKGNDPETGKSHLWHAGCCIVFLIAYELRNVGKDNRP